jgi:hypothetical protein
MALHNDDVVLVAVMPSRRDWDIAKVLGWYRVPIRSAPKTLRVDWLAFFLTGAFGEEKWSVRYAAEVRGFELRDRRELLQAETDHPRSNEPYYKVQLGPIVSLPRPIPALHLRRFTFLYTTGGRLLSAREIKDLRVRPGEEHDLLWRMLRERGRPVDREQGTVDSER